MKQFAVTSIETMPDGSVMIRGPSGTIKIGRHESNDSGYEHSFSHALMVKDKFHTCSKECSSHCIKIEELELDKGTVF